MADLETYFSEVQKKRKRKRRYFVFAGSLAAVGGILIGFFGLALKSPVFRVEKIETIGNLSLSKNQVVDIVHASIAKHYAPRWFGFQSLLVWPDELTREDLAAYPVVKDLQIKKNYFKRTVLLEVEEREPLGIWCAKTLAGISPEESQSTEVMENEEPSLAATSSQAGEFEAPGIMEDFSVGGPCWWFDEKGILFERSVSAQGSIIKVINDYSRRDIRTGGKMISEEFITPLFSVLQVLSEAGISIKEIRLNDLDYQELQVETYDGPRLLFSLRFPPQGALAVLQNLEKRSDYGKMDYVDFRVENRAYFK